MRKQRKTNIKRIISAAVVSALIASGIGYTFVSSAANTITLASSGRFEYDADGNGTINGAAGDIILDSDDLVAFKDAVTGLNSSLTAISTKAYGADGVPNYTGQLKDASGNLISGDPDDLESKYYSYQTSHSYTNTQYDDYVSSHSHTNTQYNNYVSTHSYSNTQYASASESLNGQMATVTGNDSSNVVVNTFSKSSYTSSDYVPSGCYNYSYSVWGITGFEGDCGLFRYGSSKNARISFTALHPATVYCGTTKHNLSIGDTCTAANMMIVIPKERKRTTVHTSVGNGDTSGLFCVEGSNLYASSGNRRTAVPSKKYLIWAGVYNPNQLTGTMWNCQFEGEEDTRHTVNRTGTKCFLGLFDSCNYGIYYFDSQGTKRELHGDSSGQTFGPTNYDMFTLVPVC